MKNKDAKNFTYNMIGSTVNSMISLFFLIFVTRINGIKDAGIFSFTFSTACLLQVIAYYAGRTYQVTERSKKITDADFVYNKIICCILMVLAAIVFMLVKHYSFYKCCVLFFLVLFKMIESFAEVLYGIIQKNDDLYKVGISLFLKGLLGILIFLVVDVITRNLILSVISLVIINIIIIVTYDVKNVKKYRGLSLIFNKGNVKLIFRGGFFTFLLTLLTQYVINAQKYSIDNYMPDKFQTIFGIIIMPATVIVLCGQFVIHPFLNRLTIYLKENEMKKYNKMVLKLCLSIFILGLIVILVAYFLGIPILNLFYGISLNKYRMSLVFIIIGATFFGMSYILTNALITLRDTFSQVIIFCITCVFTFFISKYMVLNYGVYGASYAYMLTMIFLTLLYIVYYIYKSVRIKSKNGVSF